MRIGINALYLIPGGVGGTEIYLRSLLSAMLEADTASEFFVFTNRETPAGLLPATPNLRAMPQGFRASVRPVRIAWEQTVLPAEAARLRLDVLFNPGFTAPAICPCPQVTVFHDLQHKRHPEYFRRFDLPFWRALLFLSAHRSKLLVAVSEATRKDLLRFYSVPPAKIRVVPHGVDPAFFSLRLNASSRPYILAVSTLHPHKNLDALLHAFAAFAQRRPEYRLVVAGLRGFHAEALEALRNSLGLEAAVTFTGWIPREELYALFAGARAFVYPSRFEGFGMPILEAMAAGLPAACANVEPMAGIAEKAALLFDPGDTQALERALELLTQDTAIRERLQAAGPLRAAAFTWQAAAQATLAVLRQAVL
ncbi:MAG: glycosyltransferase family 4 protein [Acidobacteriota bacterium]|nr:glycosyltransferase family 4 protein [Acidobacteriota bacterium]